MNILTAHITTNYSKAHILYIYLSVEIMSDILCLVSCYFTSQF